MTLQDHLKEEADIVVERIDDIKEVEVVARRERNIDAVNPEEERNDQSLEGDHTPPPPPPPLPHRCKRRRRNDENPSIPSIRRRESIGVAMNDAAMKVTVMTTAMMQHRKHQP